MLTSEGGDVCMCSQLIADIPDVDCGTHFCYIQVTLGNVSNSHLTLHFAPNTLTLNYKRQKTRQENKL